MTNEPWVEIEGPKQNIFSCGNKMDHICSHYKLKMTNVRTLISFFLLVLHPSGQHGKDY